MPAPSEPICAQISAPGCSAISVLRISGHGAIGIAAQYFRPRARLLKSPSHRVILGTFHAADGSPLDQVLCTVFRAPHSYTGEDCVEISCHGNPHIAARILENLLLEARLAHPGEFTLRALLNGRIDLTQAEAVNDLITATGSRAETAALMQVQGVLSAHLKGLLDSITAARLRCELAIDFADQDLPQIDLDDLAARISGILDQARTLHSEGAQGRFIRDGIRICLAGPPNSGKSSLFNAFLRYNRAIVTPHPGTTRDYIEEMVSLHGYTLILTDTAGLREAADAIEQEGITRSLQLMQAADLVLYLNEAGTSPESCGKAILDEEIAAKTLWLASKYDLVGEQNGTPGRATDRKGLSPQTGIPVSVVSADGLELLYQSVLERFALPQTELNRPLITNTRHLAALQKCVTALEGAQLALQNEAGFEFVAFDLISASKALEEILGVISTDDLLEQIFSSFCVGK